jgi:hypothetical protein
MRDIADLVFEDAPPAATTTPPPAASPGSPLRPWGMWGGWTAVGIACAGAVAHAVTRVRSRHRLVPELSPPPAGRGVIVSAG